MSRVLGNAARMGRDQVEVVRDAFEAFNRGDLDAVLAGTDPAIEILDPDRTGKIYRGHEGYREFMLDWLESWEEYTVEVDEIVENGDRVFVHLIQTGRGKGSGIEFSEPINNVVTFRDSKIVKFEVYVERSDAERSAGLTD